jgi:hypothetical protein
MVEPVAGIIEELAHYADAGKRYADVGLDLTLGPSRVTAGVFGH